MRKQKTIIGGASRTSPPTSMIVTHSKPVGAIHESPVIETENPYPLFLLAKEAQKKKLGKKKHAVFVELRAPHPRKRGFLKKAPFETEKQ